VNGDPVVTAGEPESGYCSCCHQPAKVVPLIMAGWPHRAWVCSLCLTKIAAKVQ
jgi:transposase